MLVQVTFGQKASILQDDTKEEQKVIRELAQFTALSRNAGIAGWVEAEWGLARNRRALNDKRWMRLRRNRLGLYGEDFDPQPRMSDLFIKRTRERIAAAHSKLMDLTMPLTGDPWDLRPRKRPKIITQNDPRAAAEGMKAVISDDLAHMDFEDVWRVAADDFCTYGFCVLKGPLAKKEEDPLWQQLGGLEGKTARMVEKSARPHFEYCSIWDIYRDPNGRNPKNCGFVTQRHVLTEIQLRELAELDGFDGDQVELLIQALPDGNYVQEWWETAMKVLNPDEPRWVVFERWGLVRKHFQLEWGIEKPTKGYLNTWTCGAFTLCVALDPFFEKEHPYLFPCYERVDLEVEGTGPAEHFEDIQTMQNALARGLHDNLRDSARPQIEADMTMLGPDTDLNYYAGKVWQSRPNELSSGRKAVNMTMIPNNSPQIIQAWQLFESLASVVTSIPTMEQQQNMGSGVRTIGQQQSIFESNGAFLRDVIGNVDQGMWKPVIHRLFNWNMAYNPDDSIKADLEPIIQGVRGAVRREKIAQNASMLQQLVTNPEAAPFLNNPRILALIVDAMGLEGEDAILTPQEMAAKLAQQAQQAGVEANMKKMGEESASHGIRAVSSRSDALMNIYSGIKDDANPVWGPAFQEAMEAQGSMTPQMYAGLKIWAMKEQADLTATLGPEVQQLVQEMVQGFQPHKALDIDPDYRQPGMAMGQPGAPEAPAQNTQPGLPPTAALPMNAAAQQGQPQAAPQQPTQ